MSGKGFDRIRPRDGQPVPPQRPDPQGRQALFSDEPAHGGGHVSISCSACGQTSVVGVREAARLALPSLHLPLLRRGHSSLMRCPACRRRTWVKVGLKA